MRRQRAVEFRSAAPQPFPRCHRGGILRCRVQCQRKHPGPGSATARILQRPQQPTTQSGLVRTRLGESRTIAGRRCNQSPIRGCLYDPTERKSPLAKNSAIPCSIGASERREAIRTGWAIRTLRPGRSCLPDQRAAFSWRQCRICDLGLSSGKRTAWTSRRLSRKDHEGYALRDLSLRKSTEMRDSRVRVRDPQCPDSRTRYDRRSVGGRITVHGRFTSALLHIGRPALVEVLEIGRRHVVESRHFYASRKIDRRHSRFQDSSSNVRRLGNWPKPASRT